MAGGGVQKIYMVFLREPSRRDITRLSPQDFFIFHFQTDNSLIITSRKANDF